MKTFRLFVLAIGAMLLFSQSSRSADHIDSPITLQDGGTGDITDVFSWMSPNADRVFLIMNLVRNAPANQRFSDSIQYVFHTFSQPSFGAARGQEIPIICTFNTAQIIQCWAGNESYVTGDASDPNGITSADGKLRVFAGLRNDPFVFNLGGFREAARQTTAALGSLTFDVAGCPALDAPTSAFLVNQLMTAPGGGPATNSFGRFNVIAIVVSIDKNVITKNGPVLSVSASTNRP